MARTRIPGLDLDARTLDSRFPLPLDAPFTARTAVDAGVSRYHLAALVETGALRRVLHGVYVATPVADCLGVRLDALRLVVPEGGVVVDATAAWIHVGDRALGLYEHQEVPPLQVYDARAGCRKRGAGLASGNRRFAVDDVEEQQGVVLTTPLRTASDVARLLPVQRSLATLDALLGCAGVDQQELVADLQRFRGFRGVRQARVLASWADGGSQSYGESALRLHWLETPDLPRPRTQLAVVRDRGTWFLDLGLEDLRFAAEYDGEAFHGPDREQYDEWRRAELAASGWTVLVFRRQHVFGREQNAANTLRREFAACTARADAEPRTWTRRG